MLCQRQSKLQSIAGKVLFSETDQHHFKLREIFHSREDSTRKENTRLVAIGLDISLGLLGVHRLYLGTDVIVPVMYTLTMGGGVVLWLVDLGLLIFTRDITPYLNNPHLFMWIRK